MESDRKTVINKITKMSKEQVSKVLIFMAGMEAENIINDQIEERQHFSSKTINNSNKQCNGQISLFYGKSAEESNDRSGSSKDFTGINI